MVEVMSLVIQGLVYGIAGMFLLLSAIIAVAGIIYPFYILFEGIKNKLL